MEKVYTKKGINFKNKKGQTFFFPRENLLKFTEHQKKMLENIQRNIARIEADLKKIDSI